MEIEIIKAGLSDFEKLKELRIKLLRFENSIDKSVRCDEKRIGEIIEHIKIYLNKGENGYFIAYAEGVACAYCHISFDDKNNPESSYIGEIFVEDKFRKNGIGKNLIEKCIEFAKKNKIKKNTLNTTIEGNSGTIEFYKRIGYKIVKEKGNKIFFEKDI